MPVSPGIYVREFDFSAYAPLLGTTTPAILGGASKGPVGIPTLVTNAADLVAKFGNPLPCNSADTSDYGLQSAIQYLQQGGRMLYCRVAHSAATASVPVPGNTGGSVAAAATGTIGFISSANPADGDTITLHATEAKADLQADVMGTAANQVITKTGANITVTGMTGGSVTAYATGSIVLTGLPISGNNVIINDGANPATTFQFGSGTDSPTLKYVAIGATPYTAITNLVTAINLVTTTLLTTASDNVARVTFEFDNNGSYNTNNPTGNSVAPYSNTPVAINAGSSLTTMTNLISAISFYGVSIAQVTVANSTSTIPQCTFTAMVPGALANGWITAFQVAGSTTIVPGTPGTVITLAGMAGGTDSVVGPVSQVLSIAASSPGTWGNGIVVQVTTTNPIGITTTDPVNDPIANRFDLAVSVPVEDGSSLTLVERFTNLSLYSGSPRYAATAVANGIYGEFGPSAYIALTVAATSASVAAGNFTLGSGVVGTNGIAGLVAADYVGTISGQTATGLQALRNPEKTEFNLLAIPGKTDIAIINAALAIAVKRGDFLYLIDSPFGLSPQQIVDWHNGTSNVVPNSPTTPINSNYAALFYPWVKVTDSYNNQDIWLPPCGFVLGAMAFTDQSVGPWWAVAGPIRGVLASGTQIEYSADQDDRDLLCGIDTSNQVNAIISRQASGLTIWGNRTLQRKRTALNSLHIRRMMLYAEKVCATAVANLVFNPNDAYTWREFQSMVNKELAAIKAGRGIAQYKVICDATTNPPQQIQNKTLRGKILIQPVEAAEIILMDFTLTPAGITTTLTG